MRRNSLAVGAAVLAMWGGAAALAQEEPGMAPADPSQQTEEQSKADAAALMRQADQALAKASSLTFKVHAMGVGGLATRSPVVDATARLLKRDGAGEKDDCPWSFLIRGTARKSGQTEGEPFATSYDGSTVRTVKEKDRVALEAMWENDEEALAVGAGWGVAWAARWKQLVSAPFGGDSESHPKCRVEGDAIVEGTACRVVYVDYSELSDPRLMDAWWYIARSDSLPRRVEMHFIDTGEGDGYGIATLTEVQTGAPVEASALALQVPDGFEVKKAKETARQRAKAAAQAPEGEGAGPRAGQPAPDWTLKDVAGKEHKLSELKGKVVVLDFWATWCPPCRMAMPGIQKIHEKYAGKPVEVIGMNMSESGDPAAYMKKQGFTYGLLLHAEEISSSYGISGIPAIFVIGKDGKVLMTQVGYSDELDAAIERAIEDGLKK